MSCMMRSLFRWALVGGLVLGGATWLIGGDQVAAGLSQLRTKARETMTAFVDDPVALRHQLQELAEQYPDRISKVKGEIAEVNQQLTALNEDNEIARRVVAMTGDDLGRLKTLVTKAEAKRDSTARQVSIRFEGVRFNINEAYNEASRINSVRQAYADRLAQGEQQVKFLEKQRSRLADILSKLQSEYEQYQTQLWQLDQQIDAIERNEELIALAKEHKATLQSYEKLGKVGNFKQIESRLKQLQAEQEAKLQALTDQSKRLNYEERAKLNVDGQSSGNIFDQINLDSGNENTSEDEADEAASKNDGSMAFADPIVIEE